MSNFFKKTKRASEEIEYDAIHGNNKLSDRKESELGKVHARMEAEFNRLAALEKENEQLKAEIERLKAENQSYFQISEMADNDYTMMQAVEFAEWLQKKSYEPTDKTYKVDLNDWRPIQAMYDLFIKEQFRKKDVS